MSKLTAVLRSKLPTSKFAGPDRSYPVNDKSHAMNAKARASEEYNKGALSAEMKGHIDKMADSIIAHHG